MAQGMLPIMITDVTVRVKTEEVPLAKTAILKSIAPSEPLKAVTTSSSFK